MSFTDADLARLKEYMETHSSVFHMFGIPHLLARLEAAEEVCVYASGLSNIWYSLTEWHWKELFMRLQSWCKAKDETV